MPLLILLLFLLLPVLEIAVFIEVGSEIGTWPTVGAIFLTAVAGTALVRAQGLEVLSRVRANLQQNQFPIEAAFDGICLALAGLLLLTPGFLTDGVGAVLLVPPARRALRGFLLGRLDIRSRGPGAGSGSSGGSSGGDGWIIEGEYEVVDDDDAKPHDRIEGP